MVAYQHAFRQHIVQERALTDQQHLLCLDVQISPGRESQVVLSQHRFEVVKHDPSRTALEGRGARTVEVTVRKAVFALWGADDQPRGAA